jgi:hypothetical protein
MRAFVEMADRQMKELEDQKRQLQEAMDALRDLRDQTAADLK